jgi:hypothetical protein
MMMWALIAASAALAQVNPRDLPADVSPAAGDLFLVYKASPVVTRNMTLGTLATYLTPVSRTITCTPPLLCNGGASMTLAADRTMSVSLPFVKSAAVADDTGDDAATIQAEIDALTADGNTIELPCGDLRINATLNIGDGSASAQSTKHNVTLKGCGMTTNAATEMTVGGTSGTRILWYGAAGGTMVDFKGPISGGGLKDLTLVGNATANIAAVGINDFHHVRADFRRVHVQGYSATGIRFDAVGAAGLPAGVAIGGDRSIWEAVNVDSPTATTANGVDIGPTTEGGVGTDNASLLFIGCNFKGGSDAAARGVILRYADNITFVRTLIQAGTNAIGVVPPGGTSNFPMAISFFDSPVLGAVAVTGSWTSTTGVRGMLFWPWVTTDGGTPTSHAKLRGVDDQGGFFGAWTGDPIAGYSLLAGRAGGQTLKGGTAASEILELRGTANATPGTVRVEDSAFVFNNAQADRDFRVASVGNANMIYSDSSANAVGIGTATPEVQFQVYGGNTSDVVIGIGPNPDGSPGTESAMTLGYGGLSFGRGGAFFNVRPDSGASGENPSLRLGANNHFAAMVTKDGALRYFSATAAPGAVADSVACWPADAAAGDATLYCINEAGRIERMTGLGRVVTTQFDKTSDTALANVTGLTFNGEAGVTYKLNGILYTTANVAGGVKVAVSGTATATSVIYEGDLDNGGTHTVTRATALGTAVCAVTAATAATCLIRGTIKINAAGTITLQFAQNASNGAASSVLVGSTFDIESVN